MLAWVLNLEFGASETEVTVTPAPHQKRFMKNLGRMMDR